MKISWIKRENASDLVMTMMSWALVTVLGTRFYLQLRGWPTISFGEWHIAHVLWGGLLMIIAMMAVISTYGQKMLRIATVVFGVGWGLFIDEIGKYLTKDNDYWFQPAIIFIYISFVGLFLIYRYLDKHEKKDTKSNIYSVLAQLESVAEGELTKKQKIKILSKIDEAAKTETDPKTIYFIKELRGFIKRSKTIKKEKTEIWTSILNFVNQFSYKKIFKKKLVMIGLIIYSGIYAIDKIIDAYKILTNPDKLELIKQFYYTYDFFSKTDIYMIVLKIIFDVIVSVLFILGLLTIANKKMQKGLRYYQWALLIIIFLSSVFKFYFEQFGGVIELAASILVYNGIIRLRKEKIA